MSTLNQPPIPAVGSIRLPYLCKPNAGSISNAFGIRAQKERGLRDWLRSSRRSPMVRRRGYASSAAPGVVIAFAVPDPSLLRRGGSDSVALGAFELATQPTSVWLTFISQSFRPTSIFTISLPLAGVNDGCWCRSKAGNGSGSRLFRSGYERKARTLEHEVVGGT